jgi:hypothetical protein
MDIIKIKDKKLKGEDYKDDTHLFDAILQEYTLCQAEAVDIEIMPAKTKLTCDTCRELYKSMMAFHGRLKK